MQRFAPIRCELIASPARICDPNGRPDALTVHSFSSAPLVDLASVPCEQLKQNKFRRRSTSLSWQRLRAQCPPFFTRVLDRSSRLPGDGYPMLRKRRIAPNHILSIRTAHRRQMKPHGSGECRAPRGASRGYVHVRRATYELRRMRGREAVHAFAHERSSARGALLLLMVLLLYFVPCCNKSSNTTAS